MATTLKLDGGDLGDEVVLIRCDLRDASAPVEINYCEGNGWEPTQYQCADCCHSSARLADLGKELAAAAVRHDDDRPFDCDASELEEEIRFSEDGRISLVWSKGEAIRCPTQHDMDTLPVGEDLTDEEIEQIDE